MALLPRSGRAFTRMGAATTRLGFALAFMLALSMAWSLCVSTRLALADASPTESATGAQEEKRTVPTPSKHVRTTSSDDSWTTRACTGAGDVVSYRLEADLPSDLASYTSYQLWFFDKLGEGLAYVEDSVQSYVVHADGSTSDVQLTVEFEEQSMRAGSDDVLGAVPGLLSTDKIVVEYDCTVLPGATMGLVGGNQNEVSLRYTRDHDSEGTGTSVPQTTSVHTLGIELHKMDADDDTPLAGASFTLQNDEGYYRTESGSWTSQASDAQIVITNDKGIATFAGVDAGTYTIAEAKAPDGYEALKAPVSVKLEVTGLGTKQATLTAATTGDATVTAVDGTSGIATITVENPKSSGEEKKPDKDSDDKSPDDKDSGGKRNGGSTSKSGSNTPKSTTTSVSSGSSGSSSTSLATTADSLPVVGTGVLVLAMVLVVAGVARRQHGASSGDGRRK